MAREMKIKNLPPDYISGLIDGEGCFALKFRRDVRHKRKNKPIYFYWDIEFAILLKATDREILEAIQKTFNCGSISQSKREHVRYSISNMDDLKEKLVPFLEKYPLRANKRFDFNLWKKALTLLHKNKGKRRNLWELSDTENLERIQKEMGRHKGSNRTWKWL